MSNLVAPDQIERIVGARRHGVQHFARAVSAEQQVYILHSKKCKDSGVDLRECPYSLALDNGIHLPDWDGLENRVVAVAIFRDQLMPLTPSWLDEFEIKEADRG